MDINPEKLVHTQNTSTKVYMAEALIILMKNKPLDKITVSNITKKAGVSRMSYYRYFTSKIEIFESYMDYILTLYSHEVDEVNHYPIKSYEHLLSSFYFFKNYKDFVLCLDSANLTDILLIRLNKYIESQLIGLPDNAFDYYSSYYYAGALCNVYIQWIKSGMQASPEDMATIVYKLSHNSEPFK